MAVVDGTIRRIATTYYASGLVDKVTSYDNAAVGSGTEKNDVKFAYNGLWQLTTEYQQTDGVVNTSTSPKVQYLYETSTTVNNARRLRMTYPNGRPLDYRVGDGGLNEKLNRVEYMRSSGEVLVDYQYFGHGGFSRVKYQEPNASFALASAGSPSIPLAASLDYFDRLKEMKWTAGSTTLEHLKWGYDAASNRTYRQNEVARAGSKEFDELYVYDDLQRLVDFKRGTLVGGAITTPTQRQEWALDKTSNWSNFEQQTPALDQQRQHNKANEIVPNCPTGTPTVICATTGAEWAGPLYDRNGNMTKMPQPAALTAAYATKYDAWNRLVEIKDGSTVIASFQYDGLNRRTIKTVGSTNRHFYYSDNWQVLEERIDTSTTADRHFVWGQRYIDDLVLRDCFVNGTLDERLYAIQDANWNVVAILDINGAVDERFAYEPSGKAIDLSAAFAPQSDSKEWDARFTGERLDLDTKFYQYRNRWYHAELGRFITRDPLNYLDRLNLYEYGRSNPLMFLDPLGLSVPQQGTFALRTMAQMARALEAGNIAEFESLARALAAGLGLVSAAEAIRMYERYARERGFPLSPPPIAVPAPAGPMPAAPPAPPPAIPGFVGGLVGAAAALVEGALAGLASQAAAWARIAAEKLREYCPNPCWVFVIRAGQHAQRLLTPEEHWQVPPNATRPAFTSLSQAAAHQHAHGQGAHNRHIDRYNTRHGGQARGGANHLAEARQVCNGLQNALDDLAKCLRSESTSGRSRIRRIELKFKEQAQTSLRGIHRRHCTRLSRPGFDER